MADLPDDLDAFRAAFEEATSKEAPAEEFSFGDTPQMADELAALVAAGVKRATAALLADLGHREDMVPRVGDRATVLDGSGAPVCVIETTQVEVAPFAAVDEAFAWDEGEGDRSLRYWVEAHRAFFERRCAELGMAFSDEQLVVFERFELLWPLPDE